MSYYIEIADIYGTATLVEYGLGKITWFLKSYRQCYFISAAIKGLLKKPWRPKGSITGYKKDQINAYSLLRLTHNSTYLILHQSWL